MSKPLTRAEIKSVLLQCDYAVLYRVGSDLKVGVNARIVSCKNSNIHDDPAVKTNFFKVIPCDINTYINCKAPFVYQ